MAEATEAMKRVWDAVEREAWEEAETNARRALTIRTAERGPDAALTANALGALATALDGRQRYDESERLWARVVSIRRAAGQNGELGDALDARATALEGVDRWEEAVPLREESIDIGEADADDDKDYVAWRRFSLAANLVRQRHFGRAIAIFEAALPAIDDGSDDKGFELRAPLMDFAVALDESGADEKAIPVYRRIARAEEAELGSAHSDLAWTLIALGSALGDIGQSDQAVAILERAVAIHGAIDPSSPATERAISILGEELLARGSHDAVGHFRRAWEMRRDRPGSTTDETTFAAGRYGEALERTGQFAEAEALYRSRLADAENAGDLAEAVFWAITLAVTLGRRYNWDQSDLFARYALDLSTKATRVCRIDARSRSNVSPVLAGQIDILRFTSSPMMRTARQLSDGSDLRQLLRLRCRLQGRGVCGCDLP